MKKVALAAFILDLIVIVSTGVATNHAKIEFDMRLDNGTFSELGF